MGQDHTPSSTTSSKLQAPIIATSTPQHQLLPLGQPHSWTDGKRNTAQIQTGGGGTLLWVTEKVSVTAAAATAVGVAVAEGVAIGAAAAAAALEVVETGKLGTAAVAVAAAVATAVAVVAAAAAAAAAVVAGMAATVVVGMGRPPGILPLPLLPLQPAGEQQGAAVPWGAPPLLPLEARHAAEGTATTSPGALHGWAPARA